MAAPTEDTMDKENIPEIVEIEATVATGFEQIAREEAEEILGIQPRTGRGKINMKIPLNEAFKVLNLGCIDNIRVVMSTMTNVEFTKNETDCMKRLREIVKDVEWTRGLKVWGKVYSFPHPISPVPDVIPENLGEPFIVSREKQPKKQKDKKMKKDKFQKEKELKRKMKEGKLKDKPSHECKEPGMESQKTEESGKPQESLETGQFDDVEDDADKKLKRNGKARDGSGDMNDDEGSAEKQTGISSVEDVKLEDVSGATENVASADENSKMEENTVDDQKTDECMTDGNNSAVTVEENNKLSQPDSTDKQDATEEAEQEEGIEEKTKKRDPTKPTFRVTCNRTGEGHSFDSMCAAANFGDAVQNYFGWNVDMKNFDIEVILNIEDRDVSVGIGLTKQSLHRRNLSSFGPTTLRPTIAYNMLRMCRIHPGDVVCDPMCGSGSIPIQGAISWPWGYHLCGDNFPKACDRTMENITSLNMSYKQQNKRPISLDVAKWDVCNLPLQDSSVDIFITDLPFGKRMGSKFNNMTLYPAALTEMARVCRPGWGRACFLTVDKKCMIKTMQSMTVRRYWQRRMILGINLGGLAAGVFLLTRTEFPFTHNTKNSQDKCSEPAPLNSKQMSAERMAAIQMAKDLTSRPLENPQENNAAENKETEVTEKPHQAEPEVEMKAESDK